MLLKKFIITVKGDMSDLYLFQLGIERMKQNKEKNAYATLSIKKITAPNPPKTKPAVTKTVGGDLRARQGK
jgi:hypothetical protein